MSVELWQQCVELLREELPAQQFNTWIRPLQVEAEGDELRVYAPNRFVLDWVNEKYLGRVLELLDEHGNGMAPALSLLIGSKRSSAPRAAPNAPLAAAASQAQAAQAPVSAPAPAPTASAPTKRATQKVAEINEEPSRDSFDPMAGASSQQAPVRAEQRTVQVEGALKHTSYLNRTFTFENFVEGVEKLFLGTLFTGEELNVIDQQCIHRTVEAFELVDRVQLQGLDHVRHETLGMQVHHLGIRVLL